MTGLRWAGLVLVWGGALSAIPSALLLFLVSALWTVPGASVPGPELSDPRLLLGLLSVGVSWTTLLVGFSLYRYGSGWVASSKKSTPRQP